MLDERLKKQFALDIVLLKYVGINPIIVHGGGKDITQWLQKIGKKSVFIDGLRVTDPETMEVTEMVLSGKINNELITLINESGGQAVGLSGKDAQLITAKKIQYKDDMGLVGSIVSVNDRILRVLSEHDYIPVVASIARSEAGENLNINADNVAAELAITVHATKLIYLTDVDGIIIDNQLCSLLDYAQAKALLSSTAIGGGMRPKLRDSLNALDNGVDRVHIINGSIENALLLELFMDKGIGTCLTV